MCAARFVDDDVGHPINRFLTPSAAMPLGGRFRDVRRISRDPGVCCEGVLGVGSKCFTEVEVVGEGAQSPGQGEEVLFGHRSHDIPWAVKYLLAEP